jgi:hypothetical protein
LVENEIKAAGLDPFQEPLSTTIKPVPPAGLCVIEMFDRVPNIPQWVGKF